MHELFARTRATKQMVVLHDADHLHFVDDVIGVHEDIRAIPATGELEWISEMLPTAELAPPESAHEFVRALTLAHFDATLRGSDTARSFLAGDVEVVLAARGIRATVGRPGDPQ